MLVKTEMDTHPHARLGVQVGQHCVQQVAHQRGLVVRGRVERHERHAPHVQVGVLQRAQEVPDARLQQPVHRRRLHAKAKQRYFNFQVLYRLIPHRSIESSLTSFAKVTQL